MRKSSRTFIAASRLAGETVKAQYLGSETYDLAVRLNRHPASGFAVTLLSVVLSVVPIIDVASWQSFAVKITTVVVTANAIGVLIYLAERRRRAARMARG